MTIRRVIPWVVLVGFVTLAGHPASADSVAQSVGTEIATRFATPDAPAEEAFIGTSPKLELIAGKDQKRAVISVGHTAPSGLQWIAKFSSPWDDDGDQGQPASLDGLANGAKLELSLTGLLLSPRPAGVEVLDAVCQAARIAVGRMNAECDERLYQDLTPRHREVRRDVAMAYFGERPWFNPVFAWSLNASVGTDEFKTLKLDLNEEKDRKSSSGFGLDLAAIWPTYLSAVVLSFEWQNAFENNKKSAATVCVPIEGVSAQRCKQGFLEPPVEDDNRLVSIEWRKQYSDDMAVKLRFTREFESDDTSVEVPIYLIKSKEGAFSAGVRFSWIDSDDKQKDGSTVAIFVTTDFSIML